MKPFEITMYVLVGKEVLAFNDMLDWATWLSVNPNYDPHVAETQVRDLWISTVCLSSDHWHFRDTIGEPVIFETAIFSKETLLEVVGRCTTYEDAHAMHFSTVDAVKKYN